MALTGMAIYKNLPKTNCGDCGFPTCMAFAMQVAAKQKAMTECPHLSDEAKSEFADASAPPMKMVRIGDPEKGRVEIGQETVMFRHEEKFHHQPAIAVRIPASLSDEEAEKKLADVCSAQFTRVGDEIGVRMAAVDIAGLDRSAAESRAGVLAAKSSLPLAILGEDPNSMAAAVKSAASAKPLVYRATEDNVDQFLAIAAENKCPLAITANTPETLADMAENAKAKGVEELVLSFDGNNVADTIRNITMVRRAALKKNFRTLGFPAMIDVSADDLLRETVLASTFVAKYAGIIIINGLDGGELLPVLTTIQNIYTDPQVPNTVEAKLYEIGEPTETSPVMFTTNFSLTYFCVEAEVERSKIPSYISVVDTEGLGVLNAYAGDKISAEKVVKTMAEQKVAEKVNHHKLIIPGLIPSFRAEIEDTSDWKEVLIGPENATGIPAFLAEKWGN
jgi:acetyl-CoA decarbonylase/synthase complex subunit gamma